MLRLNTEHVQAIGKKICWNQERFRERFDFFLEYCLAIQRNQAEKYRFFPR